MKQKNKKTISKDKLKAIFFMLMFAFGVRKGFADPVWAEIIDIDLEGTYYSYFFDKTGNGIEDGILKINPEGATASLFRRYLQRGGRILYENDGKDEFEIWGNRLLRIEMPDGRLIKVNDFAGQYSNFNRARDYEAKQAAQNSGR